LSKMSEPTKKLEVKECTRCNWRPKEAPLCEPCWNNKELISQLEDKLKLANDCIDKFESILVEDSAEGKG